MTQVGEGIAVTQVKDPEEDHWAQLEYTYPDGSPVQGMFTAVDGSGMTWTSYLNDQGQACLSGLPPGMVEYQLLPSDSLKDELQDLRTQIQKVLDDIIEEQRAEAKAHQDELDKQSHLGKVLSYHAAVRRGFWNGAVGLLTFAKDVVVKASEIATYLSPVTRLNNLLQASYTSYRNGELNPAQWRESLAKNYQEEEFKDLADLLGIDIRNLDKDEVLAIFTEAYETVAYIADDPEFRDMFIQFGKDYAGAQSSIEWAEFAGGGLFEIVLTALLLAFTGGLGNAAQIASKVRHAARLRTLGGMLRKLGKLLKRKKLSQKTRGGVDSKQKVTAEKPEGQKLSSTADEPPNQTPTDTRTGVNQSKIISRPGYDIDASKFDYFYGNVPEPDASLKVTDPKKYKQLDHNYKRSQQMKGTLESEGLGNTKEGRDGLLKIFDAASEGPEVSRHVGEYGTTITKSTETANVKYEVKFFYEGSNLSKKPKITTMIPKVKK